MDSADSLVTACHRFTARNPVTAGILSKQEAQLSQRFRAMLCIIEYFAKSFKVIGVYTYQYSIVNFIVSA